MVLRWPGPEDSQAAGNSQSPAHSGRSIRARRDAHPSMIDAVWAVIGRRRRAGGPCGCRRRGRSRRRRARRSPPAARPPLPGAPPGVAQDLVGGGEHGVGVLRGPDPPVVGVRPQPRQVRVELGDDTLGDGLGDVVLVGVLVGDGVRRASPAGCSGRWSSSSAGPWSSSPPRPRPMWARCGSRAPPPPTPRSGPSLWRWWPASCSWPSSRAWWPAIRPGWSGWWPCAFLRRRWERSPPPPSWPDCWS